MRDKKLKQFIAHVGHSLMDPFVNMSGRLRDMNVGEREDLDHEDDIPLVIKHIFVNDPQERPVPPVMKNKYATYPKEPTEPEEEKDEEEEKKEEEEQPQEEEEKNDEQEEDEEN